VGQVEQTLTGSVPDAQTTSVIQTSKGKSKFTRLIIGFQSFIEGWLSTSPFTFISPESWQTMLN
jgi:hypothetical protein